MPGATMATATVKLTAAEARFVAGFVVKEGVHGDVASLDEALGDLDWAENSTTAGLVEARPTLDVVARWAPVLDAYRSRSLPAVPWLVSWLRDEAEMAREEAERLRSVGIAAVDELEYARTFGAIAEKLAGALNEAEAVA